MAAEAKLKIGLTNKGSSVGVTGFKMVVALKRPPTPMLVTRGREMAVSGEMVVGSEMPVGSEMLVKSRTVVDKEMVVDNEMIVGSEMVVGSETVEREMPVGSEIVGSDTAGSGVVDNEMPVGSDTLSHWDELRLTNDSQHRPVLMKSNSIMQKTH
jgi:hypothetical protein